MIPGAFFARHVNGGKMHLDVDFFWSEVYYFIWSTISKEY